MNKESEFFLAVITKTICETYQEKMDQIQQNKFGWGRFKKLAIRHELAPLIHSLLKDLSVHVPVEMQEFFKQSYYFYLSRSQCFWREFLRILTAFEKKGITLLPLKGIALLEDLYSQAPVRMMADIDLLTKREDLKQAKDLLGDLGYQRRLDGLKEEYWLDQHAHLEFQGGVGGKFLLDLHWSLDFKRKGRYVLSELWDRVREIEVGARKIKVLSPEDTLFSLALHNRRFGNTLGFKSVYDAVLLLRKYGQSFDWDYCLGMSRKYDLRACLFFMLYQVEFLGGMKIPRRVRHELGLSCLRKKMSQRFIEKNSFRDEDDPNSKKTLYLKKILYLKSHFLLYDSFWEPLEYILDIPKEQFAKYYGLEPYTRKAEALYNLRFIYIPFKTIWDWVKRMV